MALRKIHNTYYVYFKDIDGTQRTRSLKTTDKATAEKLHQKFMVTLQAKKGELAIMRTFPERFPQLNEIKTVAPPIIEPPANKRFRLERMLPELDLIKAPAGTDRRIIKRFVEKVGKKYADEVTPDVALHYLEKHYTSGRNFKNFNKKDQDFYSWSSGISGTSGVRFIGISSFPFFLNLLYAFTNSLARKIHCFA